jgi:hypothetical protein
MAATDYERYFVRKPLYEAVPGVKNRQSPAMTFMSSRQIPEAGAYIQLGWIYDIPTPNPYVYEHVHDYDEVLLFWGSDSGIPQVLGGEIELYIGGQPIVFNTTSSMFIPKGTPHGPLTWKKFRYPHMVMCLMIGTGDYQEGWGKSGIHEPKEGLPEKTVDFDYEQYVIRSPMREAAPGFKGFQSPSMTYMSSVQINSANLYLDWAWVWNIPSPPIGEHMHQNNDEIVLHIGGDPDNPEDLGADMEYGIGGDMSAFSTSYGAFLPRGLRHGPLRWHRVRKPHIEMAIVFGVGTFQVRSEATTRL